MWNFLRIVLIRRLRDVIWMCSQSSIFLVWSSLMRISVAWRRHLPFKRKKNETGNSIGIKPVNSRHTDNNNGTYKLERTIKIKERNYIPRRRGIEHVRTASEYSKNSNSSRPSKSLIWFPKDIWVEWKKKLSIASHVLVDWGRPKVSDTGTAYLQDIHDCLLWNFCRLASKLFCPIAVFHYWWHHPRCSAASTSTPPLIIMHYSLLFEQYAVLVSDIRIIEPFCPLGESGGNIKRRHVTTY